jgi:hypothetical protein
MMRWEKVMDRLRDMSTKTRQRVRAWTGQLVVVALAGLSLIDIWVVSLSDVTTGLRLINTSILFAICLALV